MHALLALTLVLLGPTDIAVTRWMSPDSSRPMTFSEWQAGLSRTDDWKINHINTIGSGFVDRVDILVQDSLVPVLSASLDTMTADLVREGYTVAGFSVSGTSPESLRAFLQAEYDSGLVAAVLIGDLPVAWYQLINDFQGNGSNDGYEEFPCDLYFMDLDGVWLDSFVRLDSLDSLVPGFDSIYDSHTGAVGPEIGVSRLPASAIGNQDSLLLNYLSRAHQYRTGQLQVADRALVYIDDDWYTNAWYWDQDVGLLYPNRVSIWNKESTRALDYRPRIDSAPYQWIQLCAHSWPGGHAWKYCHGDSWDRFYATEIDTLGIEACFYNLFACSNVRFIEPGYCGGRYVFQTRDGLGAIGSCKTGSMLEFQDFYGPLGNGLPLALAFHEWFDDQARGGFDASERSWFYGMCLIADGLLKPRWTIGVEQPQAQLPLACHVRPLQTPVRNVLGLELVLNRPTHARLRLVDRIGRTVSSVHDGRLEPGTHLVNADVSRIPAGVYFLLLDTGTGRSCKPITIIH